jgi:hypothetical protein
MRVGVETLFTSALSLVAPWEVAKVDLDTFRCTSIKSAPKAR